jgi:segregation and condensation protein B
MSDEHDDEAPDILEVIQDTTDSEHELSGPLPDVRTALEAVLLVVDEPVADVVLAQIVERPTEEVGRLLAELAAEYDEQGRGFDLRHVSGGWRLYTRESCAPYVERFVRDGQQARLTQAALETLAVVAYRQPVSRSRIAGIRGVNVDAVMRTLVTRGLITEVGTERESGAILYGTTTYFLERLGLDAVDDLPPLSDYLPDQFALDEDDVSTSR